MKTLTILLMLSLMGCATNNLKVKLFHEVTIEEVINQRHNGCLTEYILHNFDPDIGFETTKYEAISGCSDIKFQAFEHELKNGFKIYYYEEIDKLGFGESGYALVINNQIIEKYITALHFIIT